MVPILFKNLLLAFLCINIAFLGADAAPKSKPGNKAKLEAMIKKKFKSATPKQLDQYKLDAAKGLEADLATAMQALSTGSNVPADVQKSAKDVLSAIKGGKLTQPLAKNMHTILQKAANKPGKPAEQVQIALAQAYPNAPADLKNPLQAVMNFLNTTLSGVTNTLGKTLGGVPDLLTGPVRTLTGTLGAVTDTLGGTLGSVGALLGGLLSG